MNFLIIDDHPLVKEGIELRIKKIFSDANCYFADNIRMAHSRISQYPIDLIFCDLEFSGETDIDGFYIRKSIKKFEPRIKFIALTNYNSYRIMNMAMNNNFHSFLEKGCSFNEFSITLNAVLELGDNEIFESETIKKLKNKRSQFVGSIFSDSLHGISDLSPRELELTIYTAKTTDKYELAELMKVKPMTIDTYFKRILLKLSLKHRKELSLFSLEFKDELLKYFSK